MSEAAASIGSTLDLSQTAAEVVGVAVPRFADLAVLYGAERLLAADEFISPGGGRGAVLRRLAARVADQDPAATDRLLRPGEVLVLADGTPGARAMATGQALLFDRPDDEATERLRLRPGGPELISGYDSFLVLPLIARGVVVGCVVFGRTLARRPFSAGEIALAGELASRAAVCIDNARLYHREQRTALALQRGLLPGQLRVPAGMEVAQCYLPVGESVVGGDWHDIVPLSGGGAAL
ncbi:MAG TPA: GAF domain-containing protein, partial [Streptosporangiaceae bacterium]